MVLRKTWRRDQLTLFQEIHSSWDDLRKLKLGICLALLEMIIISMAEHTLAQSQIVPDDSLGTEKSQIINNFNGVAQEGITGGSVRGMNLFHSFREFHVSEGKTVYFANPTGIENILARVTGSNRSEILGKLGVLGNANLFLLNPNGIIFGADASLDIRGSFVATSANSIKFGEQGFFSASSPQAVPLLTVKPSALFFNQIGAGAIENRSIVAVGEDKSQNPLFGLSVGDGKSLLLVGGNILNTGEINALGGRVELASVASVGEIGLEVDGNHISLTFPQEIARGDISLRNGAIVNVAADGGGAIALTGHNIDISEESLVLAGITTGLGTAEAKAGDISLNATQAISLSQKSAVVNQIEVNATGISGNINLQAGSLDVTGASFFSTRSLGIANSGSIYANVSGPVLLSSDNIESYSYFGVGIARTAIGNGGEIHLKADSLTMDKGGFLGSRSLGQGNAGNIFIDVNGAINLYGGEENGYNFSSTIRSLVTETGTGNGGEIHIKAESLTMTQGANISSSTWSKGNSGSIFIDVKGAILLDGEPRLNIPNTYAYITSQVVPQAVGNGGDIHMSADSLTITGNSFINTTTFGQGKSGNIFINVQDAVKLDMGIIGSDVGKQAIGDGGDIKITADSLSITRGSFLGSSTFGKGNAGSIFIDVKGAVNLDGKDTNGFTSEITSKVGNIAIGNGGNIHLKAESLNLNQGANLSASTLGQGKGGNIQIETSKFVNLSNDAEISVNSQSQGNAGDLSIKTNSLTLRGRSQLLADTFSSEGGNIQLQVRDLLLLRNNSSISTTAGLQETGGNGGNIDINSKFLVAVADENSDITANAFAGKGGLIRINTQGIFGIEEREILTKLSDITAFSQQNPQLNGEIIINTPNADINNELVALPTNVVDASRLITQGCAASTVANRQSQSQFTITGRGGIPPQPNHALRVPAIAISTNSLTTTQSHQPLPVNPTLEANTWSLNDQGQIILSVSPTAYASTWRKNDNKCQNSS
ncbi:filamentous hemagglutinin [Nostoc sp. CMAA1605]|nr:filamentous hemagglutinin [Nostoc sp. CMAA1605]